jgi:hypothetical protein
MVGLSLCFIQSLLEKAHVVRVCLPTLLPVCRKGTMFSLTAALLVLVISSMASTCGPPVSRVYPVDLSA